MAGELGFFGVKLHVDAPITNQCNAKIRTSINPVFHHVGNIDRNELARVRTVDRYADYRGRADKP
jgi:hypothetical protein